MLSKIKRFKFDYIVYLLLGLACITFGIVVLPFVTDFGKNILEIITAVFLIVYLIGFLLPKVLKKKNNLILAFHIIEFVVVGLLALGNILSQFKILNISGVTETLGVTLFMRGLSELVVSYCANTEHRKKFYLFLIDVVILSFGVYLFAKPILTDEQVLIILGTLFILLGALATFIAVKFWKRLPKAEREAKKKAKLAKKQETIAKKQEKQAKKEEKREIKAKKEEAKQAKKESK